MEHMKVFISFVSKLDRRPIIGTENQVDKVSHFSSLKRKHIQSWYNFFMSQLQNETEDPSKQLKKEANL